MYKSKYLFTPDMSALSYILTSPPRCVCNENLQQKGDTYKHISLCIRDSITTTEVGEFKGHHTERYFYIKAPICVGTNVLVLLYYAYSRAGSLRLPRKHRSRQNSANKPVLIIKELHIQTFFL